MVIIDLQDAKVAWCAYFILNINLKSIKGLLLECNGDHHFHR